ncbi:MAG: ATP synthase F1 subunit epsilon [Cetobacterium sp.]|uniref:ATP synthase F1 subunit epsilon n=1 Tax=unclassified Cetobacterium TaxID=2630983 RepID=UPI00163B9D68|nr:ATP synthase F1 subunit epsilon [Cetobacterium sp. 2A]MBC2856396.1 ATP synthase F1 subunit epsilon [Cetobacterium sp. 2A]
MASFILEVVTPLKKVLEQEAEFLLIRTTEGDLGVLPNHSPFVAELATGEMKIESKGVENFFYISGGFMEISNNRVIILADEAMDVKDIDLELARKEARIVQEKLEKINEDREFALTQKTLSQALAKVRIAEKNL